MSDDSPPPLTLYIGKKHFKITLLSRVILRKRQNTFLEFFVHDTCKMIYNHLTFTHVKYGEKKLETSYSDASLLQTFKRL